MKKMRICLSICMIIILLSLSVITTLAMEIPNNNEHLLHKASDSLITAMSTADDDSLLPVWIWFSEIDFNEANVQIQKLSGYSADEFSSKKKSSYQPRLVEIIDSVYNTDITKDELEQLRIENKQILKEIEPEHEAKTKLIREYEGIRSKVLQEMYTAHNSEIISELGISSDRIIYQCDFTPSAIINLTVEEIVEVSADRNVTELFYYEDPEPVEPTDPQTNEMNAMHANLVTQANGLGYTGSGVNILVVGGQGYVGNQNVEDLPYDYPETVYNVVNNHAYSIVDTENLPTNNLDDHAQHVVNILKQYAPQANLYVVPWNDFVNFKWTVNECNIDFVCYAMAYGVYNQTYESFSKWFDVYTKNKDLPFIASAGNSENWFSGGWPAICVPARGYNSIATGSYLTPYYTSMQQDHMRNYRYAPTTSTSVACFKPDIVCAANDTSTAAPALSGILSWVIQANSDLERNPEVIKAITMASCHRKVKPYNNSEPQENMADGLTQKQGSGAIDAFRMIRIALGHTYGEAQLTTNSTEYQTDLLVSENTCQTSTMIFDNDNLNVSIAWMVDGEASSTPSTGTTVNSIQDLFLEVYEDTDLVSHSYSENAGKQTAYLVNGSSNAIYSIKVNNVTDANNLRSIKFGYAWCEKGCSELTSVEINGIPAVGQTLNAVVTDSNGATPTALNNYPYHWQRSFDNGITWSSDFSNNAFYVVTENDFGSLIRCKVEPLECSLYSPTTIFGQTQTNIVKFGDVNLDGIVDSSDPILIQYYLASISNLSDAQKIAADVDLDGYVSIIDATWIWRYIEGMITTLPIV